MRLKESIIKFFIQEPNITKSELRQLHIEIKDYFERSATSETLCYTLHRTDTSRPHPLTSLTPDPTLSQGENGLVNQVELLGLAHCNSKHFMPNPVKKYTDT